MLWDVVKRLCGVCVATDQVLIRASGELNRWPHVWNNGRPGVEAQVTGYKEWSYSGVHITQWARYTSLDSSVCRAKDDTRYPSVAGSNPAREILLLPCANHFVSKWFTLPQTIWCFWPKYKTILFWTYKNKNIADLFLNCNWTKGFKAYTCFNAYLFLNKYWEIRRSDYIWFTLCAYIMCMYIACCWWKPYPWPLQKYITFPSSNITTNFHNNTF